MARFVGKEEGRWYGKNGGRFGINQENEEEMGKRGRRNGT